MEGLPPYLPFIEMLEHSARSLPPDTFRYALGADARLARQRLAQFA